MTMAYPSNLKSQLGSCLGPGFMSKVRRIIWLKLDAISECDRLASRYLGHLTCVANLPGQRGLRSASSKCLEAPLVDCRLLVAEHSALLVHEFVTAFRTK